MIKTNITFEKESETSINILRDGKHVGNIWSESKDGSMPYSNETKDSIQICGFDTISEIWGCGIFKGHKDCVIEFFNIDSKEFKEQEQNKYKKYLQLKIQNNELDDVQSFQDFFKYNLDGR